MIKIVFFCGKSFRKSAEPRLRAFAEFVWRKAEEFAEGMIEITYAVIAEFVDDFKRVEVGGFK